MILPEDKIKSKNKPELQTQAINKSKPVKKRKKREEKVDNEKLEAYKRNTLNWLNFSMHPQTEDAIRDRIMKEIEEEDASKYVCISYVCRYSKLSEEFIEELDSLTSQMRKYTVFSKDKVPEGESQWQLVNRNSSRLDWRNICQYQKLSEDFIERHKNDVLWPIIFSHQDLSEEFKREHYTYYKQALDDSAEKSISSASKSNVESY